MPNATLSRAFGFAGFRQLSVVVAAVLLSGIGQVRASDFALTVASPLPSGRETRESVKASPSSTLDARTALIAAKTLAAQIPGGSVVTVLPTGSMRPTFDEKAYLVVEPAPFASLQVGDIITFKHPRVNSMVVHRIMEKHGNSVWTKGDYNSRPDDEYVTPANYRMRVVAMIYARDGANTLAQAATTGGKLAMN